MFGILNIRKPSGLTSRDCVNRIQRLVRPEKVGHSGTLDPMADGVLIVPVGQAVRLVDWLHQLPKTYVGTFQLGVRSPSCDTESIVESLPDPPVPHGKRFNPFWASFWGPSPGPPHLLGCPDRRQTCLPTSAGWRKHRHAKSFD